MQLDTFSRYVRFSEVPEANFELGRWYETRGHDSPALSFYLKTAELGDEASIEDQELYVLVYESLIRAHFCVARQKTRGFTAKSLLHRAIAFAPERPEAYYLLAVFEQNAGNMSECYMLSCIGERYDYVSQPLSTDIGYSGAHCFLLTKAVSAFHLGRGQEARITLQDILDLYRHKISAEELRRVDILVKQWGVGGPEVADVPYILSEHLNRLRCCFNGCDTIERNYSQCFQDMFVLLTTNGQKNGTYLEIGSEDPQYKSNTYLLESKFDWKGISVEIDQPEVERFRQLRSNPVICADATKLDYASILKKANMPEIIDYLQIDTEPSSTSFEVLVSMPFDKYKFRVITFEHDHAVDSSRTYREKSRRYLKSLGYELVVPDIGPTDWYSFEDWWVMPELIDPAQLEIIRSLPPKFPISAANAVYDLFLEV